MQLCPTICALHSPTHLQGCHGKCIGTNLVRQKDGGRNCSMSVTIGLDHYNDRTLLAICCRFYLGIVVRQGRETNLVDGPMQGSIYHNTLLLGFLRTATSPHNNVSNRRKRFHVAVGFIVRHDAVKATMLSF